MFHWCHFMFFSLFWSQSLGEKKNHYPEQSLLLFVPDFFFFLLSPINFLWLKCLFDFQLKAWSWSFLFHDILLEDELVPLNETGGRCSVLCYAVTFILFVQVCFTWIENGIGIPFLSLFSMSWFAENKDCNFTISHFMSEKLPSLFFGRVRFVARELHFTSNMNPFGNWNANKILISFQNSW